jgi:1-deoxy-D-xylulose-5-phosphate reductoisomerase
MPALDLLTAPALTFEAPDTRRFPCLGLAYHAGRQGGAAPAVLNAANEVAVDAFLKGKLGFTGIPALLARVLNRFQRRPRAQRLAQTLDQVLAADAWGRLAANELLALQRPR